MCLHAADAIRNKYEMWTGWVCSGSDWGSREEEFEGLTVGHIDPGSGLASQVHALLVNFNIGDEGYYFKHWRVHDTSSFVQR